MKAKIKIVKVPALKPRRLREFNFKLFVDGVQQKPKYPYYEEE